MTTTTDHRSELNRAAPAVVWSTFVLSLLGVGLSTYLTVLHYNTHLQPFCPNTGVINCGDVITGAYSSAFSIPFAVLGLGYWIAMVVLNSPPLWASDLRWVHQLRLVSIVGGMGFCCYLIYIELFIKNHICLWCTSVHLTTFVVFVLVITSVPTMLERSR